MAASKRVLDGKAQAVTELERELSSGLRTAVARLARALRHTQAGAALTPTQTSVLSLTVARGPIGLGDLAAAEGINPTLLSRIVRRLEDEGLVVRRSDEDDRRIGLLEVTREGRRLSDRIHTERADALNGAIRSLSLEEREVLREALPILERVSHFVKDPGR